MTVESATVNVRPAVSNLVRNAIRHNRDGGRASVNVSSDTALARLVVVNDGPLIAYPDVAVLIEPFTRGGGRSSTRGRGHGLGLAIVDASVRAMDGTLTLRANPTGGLTATIELARA